MLMQHMFTIISFSGLFVDFGLTCSKRILTKKKCDQKWGFPITIHLYSLMMFKDQLQIQTAKTVTEF